MLLRLAFFTLLSSVLLCAQDVTVTARLAFDKTGGKNLNAPSAVVWLNPQSAVSDTASATAANRPRLVQHNKAFEPHVLVVPVGSVVAFPNRDPFFHNVFSLFDGKRFDLGLYEAGSTRDVHFDKPGISYIFCNIHPEMSAVVISLDTPYYAVSNSGGELILPHVPPGKYTLHLWYEGALPETLRAASREVTVNEANTTLGVLRLPEVPLPTSHKNLYGRDYDPPTPASPAYARP
jgi:plastocyanin